MSDHLVSENHLGKSASMVVAAVVVVIVEDMMGHLD
jgi:hypothetical protein